MSSAHSTVHYAIRVFHPPSTDTRQFVTRYRTYCVRTWFFFWFVCVPRVCVYLGHSTRAAGPASASRPAAGRPNQCDRAASRLRRCGCVCVCWWLLWRCWCETGSCELCVCVLIVVVLAGCFADDQVKIETKRTNKRSERGYWANARGTQDTTRHNNEGLLDLLWGAGRGTMGSRRAGTQNTVVVLVSVRCVLVGSVRL